jgi:hypothetical protein
MNTFLLLRLLFTLSVVLGISKLTITNELPVNQTISLPDLNGQKLNTEKDLLSLLPFLMGLDHGTDHNEDDKFHAFSFDRIRRRPNGFSIRCVVVKVVLVLVYVCILLLTLCHFQQSLHFVC